MTHENRKRKKGLTKFAPPAPTIADDPDLRNIEFWARIGIKAVKVAHEYGEEAAGHWISEWGGMPEASDPSSASAVASVSVESMIGPSITFKKVFVGRKEGAVQNETAYIEGLACRFPREPATDLWTKLRLEIQNRADGCPFNYDFNRKDVVLKANGNPMKKKTFLNKVSLIRTKAK